MTSACPCRRNGWLLCGLPLRIVCRPCVRYGETDDLAREAADGTRHECQVIAGPVTKDHMARAATDPLALAFLIDCHWGAPVCDMVLKRTSCVLRAYAASSRDTRASM